MADRKLKVALVHDWLTGMRGGEKVLEEMCQLYPQADLFTLLHNPGSVSELISDRHIVTSFINRLPFKKHRYRHYLPLFPTAIELLDLRGYDLILSSSHCVAKGVRTPPSALHISYVHTPMRYVWDMYESYFSRDQIGFLASLIVPPVASYLRMWDVTSSNRVDHMVANSAHVARRIARYYRREATVIHPPVDTRFFQPGDVQGDYYIMLSALVPYKRVDLAIEVFNDLGAPLHIIGSGPQAETLWKMAGKNIRFFDWLPREEVLDHMQRCRALIFPGEEDFGIVPLEAQSCGKPVIALGRGGAMETVLPFDGQNEGRCSGIFFENPRCAELRAAIEQYEALSWDAAFINRHAQGFGRARFRERFSGFVAEKSKAFFESAL